VAEDYLSRIRPQMRRGRRLAVDALDRAQQTKLGTGSVSALDNLIDATTGTVRLKALFKNQNGTLFPNQFVNSRLLIDTLRGVTLIPTAAIQRNDTATFVYIVNPDQTVSIRNVTVTGTDGDTSAVQDVDPGEIVVIDGFDKLQEGARVAIREGPAPPEVSQQQNPGSENRGAQRAEGASGGEGQQRQQRAQRQQSEQQQGEQEKQGDQRQQGAGNASGPECDQQASPGNQRHARRGARR